MKNVPPTKNAVPKKIAGLIDDDRADRAARRESQDSKMFRDATKREKKIYKSWQTNMLKEREAYDAMIQMALVTMQIAKETKENNARNRIHQTKIHKAITKPVKTAAAAAEHRGKKIVKGVVAGGLVVLTGGGAAYMVHKYGGGKEKEEPKSLVRRLSRDLINSSAFLKVVATTGAAIKDSLSGFLDRLRGDFRYVLGEEVAEIYNTAKKGFLGVFKIIKSFFLIKFGQILSRKALMFFGASKEFAEKITSPFFYLKQMLGSLKFLPGLFRGIKKGRDIAVAGGGAVGAGAKAVGRGVVAAGKAVHGAIISGELEGKLKDWTKDKWTSIKKQFGEEGGVIKEKAKAAYKFAKEKIAPELRPVWDASMTFSKIMYGKMFPIIDKLVLAFQALYDVLPKRERPAGEAPKEEPKEAPKKKKKKPKAKGFGLDFLGGEAGAVGYDIAPGLMGEPFKEYAKLEPKGTGNFRKAAKQWLHTGKTWLLDKLYPLDETGTVGPDIGEGKPRKRKEPKETVATTKVLKEKRDAGATSKVLKGIWGFLRGAGKTAGKTAGAVVSKAAPAAGGGIMATIGAIIMGAFTLLPALGTIVTTLGTALGSFVSIASTLAKGAAKILPFIAIIEGLLNPPKDEQGQVGLARRVGSGAAAGVGAWAGVKAGAWAGGALGSALGPVGAGVGAAAGGLLGGLAGSVIGKRIGAEVGEPLMEIGKKLWSAGEYLTEKVLEPLASALGWFAGKLLWFIDGVFGIIGKIWTTVDKVSAWLDETIYGAIKWVLDAPGKIYDAAKDAWNSIVDFFASLPGKIWEGIKNAAKSVLPASLLGWITGEPGGPTVPTPVQTGAPTIPSAPEMHTGGLVGATGPAILQAGERVLSRQQNDAFIKGGIVIGSISDSVVDSIQIAVSRALEGEFYQTSWFWMNWLQPILDKITDIHNIIVNKFLGETFGTNAVEKVAMDIQKGAARGAMDAAIEQGGIGTGMAVAAGAAAGAGGPGTPVARAALVKSQLEGMGYGAPQIEAMLGNIARETGGTFDPGIEQKGGPGRGLFQWTKDQRWADYLKWAKENNIQNPENSIPGQLAFADYELKNTMKGVGNEFFAAKTPQEANRIFAKRFEAPRAINEGGPGAEQEILKRQLFGQQWMKQAGEYRPEVGVAGGALPSSIQTALDTAVQSAKAGTLAAENCGDMVAKVTNPALRAAYGEGTMQLEKGGLGMDAAARMSKAYGSKLYKSGETPFTADFLRTLPEGTIMVGETGKRGGHAEMIAKNPETGERGVLSQGPGPPRFKTFEGAARDIGPHPWTATDPFEKMREKAGMPSAMGGFFPSPAPAPEPISDAQKVAERTMENKQVNLKTQFETMQKGFAAMANLQTAPGQQMIAVPAEQNQISRDMNIPIRFEDSILEFGSAMLGVLRG